jgi:S-adenosylmethionine:tRNA ribosyltransferase-isomerase
VYSEYSVVPLPFSQDNFNSIVPFKRMRIPGAAYREFDSVLVLEQSAAVRTADFDYDLPGELIAQTPSAVRGGSRLLTLNRATRAIAHRTFRDLPSLLRKDDVLVLNNSRVVPARLHGVNAATGGRFEVFLLEENALNDWWVLMRPGKRARTGTRIILQDRAGGATGYCARVVGSNVEGHRRVVFEGVGDILRLLDEIGEVPLPPYITREDGTHEADRERYQTVFAQPPGSVAAPTAGLHFTDELLDLIRSRGVRVCFVTLHVGLGTFAPVKTEVINAHLMHEERYELSPETVQAIEGSRERGGRVVAVGTTTLRLLEAVAAANDGRLVSGSGRTRIFIYPPFNFQVVDVMLTNFHLPRSTLLMLVSAFASPGALDGRDLVLAAYAEAVRECYRFFSYGDAMLLV